jgi:hypothetical protein
MKYKILRTDGNYDFHNNSTITELPEGAIALTDEEWELRLEPSETQKLANAKTARLAQLDKNRNDFCLIPIEYQGNTYATTINAWAAISYLANGLATLSTTAEYPNYPQGDNITLTKADFKAIATLIQTREMESRNVRKSKVDEINACTTLEQVNAINITF